jgi:mono/diheme cytochrome c family protein
MLKKTLIYGGIALVVLAILIQFIPYGHNHTNPAVVKAAAWDSQQTKALAQRACFDCHSNETNWRWYTNIAPFSWLIQHDVDEGRSRLNWSECGVARPRRGGEGGFEGEGGGDAAEIVLRGEMPPPQYTIMHPEARLTTAEREALAQGFSNSPCQ